MSDTPNGEPAAPMTAGQLARFDPASPSPVAAMLQAAVERGITAENVAVVERLVGLYERMQERDAEKQFAAAFVALQSDMPAIQANRAVPNNDGTLRYMYAPYEDIMAAVRPLFQKHGFTVTFSSDFKEGRIIQSCTLQHVGGHKRTNQFMARIGKGPPGSSEAQGDGAASTYAKRFALCDCLNITIESDNDARADGAPITPEQAIYLRERVKETKSNEAAFLKFAGAATYDEIGADRFDRLVESLKKKEARQ